MKNRATTLNLILILSTAFISSCVTRMPTPNGIKDISTYEYESLIKNKTQKAEVYDGLYNKLTVTATIIDADLTETQAAYSAKIMQWNEDKYKTEKAKMIAKHSDTTEFFLSFYTPERKHDDLNSSQTSWKIYLEIAGQRYEGKITKIKTLFLDLVEIYPQHNKFSTPYLVTFPLATATSESKPMTLIVTGPLATTQLKFNH